VVSAIVEEALVVDADASLAADVEHEALTPPQRSLSASSCEQAVTATARIEITVNVRTSLRMGA